MLAVWSWPLRYMPPPCRGGRAAVSGGGAGAGEAFVLRPAGAARARRDHPVVLAPGGKRPLQPQVLLLLLLLLLLVVVVELLLLLRNQRLRG